MNQQSLEKKFLADLQRGDGNALTKVILEHRDQLIPYARRHLSDSSQAEDIVQEAFLRLPEKLKGREFFCAGFLRGLVAQLCSNQRRKAARRGERSLEDTGESTDRQQRNDPPDKRFLDPADVAERQEVWVAVSKLPKRERLVITMKYIEHATVDEIACAVGCSSRHVGNLYDAAKALLRRTLIDYGLPTDAASNQPDADIAT